MSSDMVCSSCGHALARSQGVDYLGDHVRHMHRDDCIRSLRAEVERLNIALEMHDKIETQTNAENERLTQERDHLLALLQRAEPIIEDCLNDAPQTPLDDIEGLLEDIRAMKG